MYKFTYFKKMYIVVNYHINFLVLFEKQHTSSLSNAQFLNKLTFKHYSLTAAMK
jgi:hypothetical protein